MPAERRARGPIVAVSQGAAFCALVLLGVTLAAAGPMLQRGAGPPASASPRARFQAIPEFRPQGAFGSPGGFPFMGAHDLQGRPHRLSRHAFFPALPSTGFLYTPSALYTSQAEPPTPVVNVAPVTYVTPTVYLSAPVVPTEPSPVAAAPAAAPPVPSVVEYPTGRYELRGDGIATPYVWVWIPNPPPAPPAVSSPSTEAPAAAVPASRTPTYRWTDGDGTIFLTNRPEAVPEAYRSRAPGPAALVTPQ